MGMKEINDRAKDARAVVASLEANAEQVGEGFAAALARHLQRGEEMPDVGLVFRLLGRDLSARSSAAVSAATTHEDELLDDPPWRAKRGAALVEARGVLTDLRDALTTAYGEEAAAKLGLASPPSFDPAVLAETGANVLKKLRDPKTKLPPRRRRGVAVKLEDFAEDLEPPLTRLQEAVSAVAREVREGEKTQTAKDESTLHFDGGFSAITALAVAGYQYAGLDPLADRLRPVARRAASGTPADAGPAEATSGATGAAETEEP